MKKRTDKFIKRLAAGMGIFIGILLLLAGAFFGILTLVEYRPGEVEQAEVQYPAALPGLGRPARGVPFSVLSWNIGYASLDESQDFFMDGGKSVRPASDENVRRNLAAIGEFIGGADCDAALLQEVDDASRRSYYVDENARLAEAFPGSSVFAYNFRAFFVPFPFPGFIGRVSSGLLTLNRFETSGALRISLPNPFSWPVRTANLKRCLLVSRIPVQESGAELVLVNLHLEAYDSGGGREAQTRALLDFLYGEYGKGNYCIAGGDFNQSFPGIDRERFSIKNAGYFVPGTLDPAALAPLWRYVTGVHKPSSRLLNEPYRKASDKTQLYVIDGFLISPNVELISAETIDLDFRHSDHNPVKITAALK